MASSQNTQPQEGCGCLSLRDLTQIKAGRTQGFPSFSAGISLLHILGHCPGQPGPRCSSLAGREARMGNPWMGQHSWKPGRPLERSRNTQRHEAAHSAGQQRLLRPWQVLTFHFGMPGSGFPGGQEDSVPPFQTHHHPHSLFPAAQLCPRLTRSLSQ